MPIYVDTFEKYNVSTLVFFPEVRPRTKKLRVKDRTLLLDSNDEGSRVKFSPSTNNFLSYWLYNNMLCALQDSAKDFKVVEVGARDGLQNEKVPRIIIYRLNWLNMLLYLAYSLGQLLAY